jgi:hypothetical protein
MPVPTLIRSWKIWACECLKLLWAAYALLTSIYCLLAFFPYTYYALIKSPVYDWMPWFALHHALLYWFALLAATVGYWSSLRRTRFALVIPGVLCASGIAITVHPFLSTLDGGMTAYQWSIAALVPALLLGAVDLLSSWNEDREPDQKYILYGPALLSAFMIAILSFAGPLIQELRNTGAVLNAGNLQLAGWNLASHLVLATLIVSVLNLVWISAFKTSRPRLTQWLVVGVGILVIASLALNNFLHSAFGFTGWRAALYSGLLVSTLLTVSSASLVSLANQLLPEFQARSTQRWGKLLIAAVAAVVSALAIILPSVINEWVFQWLFTSFIWVTLTVCFYLLWARSRSYSAPAVIAVLVVTVVSYKILQMADVLWGRSLGSTQYEIADALEKYAGRNFSFQLVHRFLGNASADGPCDDFCRILRDNTNIRDARTQRQITFVDHLVPNSTAPNIFMVVIDSLRPDYLGVYNRKVDFTPNIDALATDSVVFRNTYSQYAGTYLSEPAIWSGAMLLHAHYIRPFENVNGLEKLIKGDGYKMVVSYDNVLSQVLSPGDDLIRLDTAKKSWKALEFCSTERQLQAVLDSEADRARPIFFYAQPQNVHMFSANDQPTVRSVNWKKPGFDPRISLAVHQVDGCIGEFLTDLKARGLYDNSIIIVTSDHGDATGELGRKAHSYTIYPEIMHVPLLVHLPRSMRGKFVCDPQRIVTLTDITPSLYYLLGHRPVKQDPMLGHPLFAEDQAELSSYGRKELFLASDEVPVYGLLDNGRYMYVTYASPARSFLFDLASDPDAQHNILTDSLKKQYDERIIDHLRMIGDFYGHNLGIKSLLASENR